MKMPEMQSSDGVRVSIIIPCRNEEQYIGKCLDNIIMSTYPAERLEILVVDGMSNDGTRERILPYTERYPFVRLIDNPMKITPAAMNAGIKNASGDIIIRADAHAAYPSDYVSKLVAWMERTGADNVGGVLVTRPGGEGRMAAAIAVAVLHPFGVGNFYFRIGTAKPRWVDTVPFGCWRKSVFARIGLFDEDLVRNQDDELNFRLLRAGGRLLLVPDIVVKYFVRGRLSQLWQMYAQYGFFKPLVARKVRSVVTVRQLVPAGLVCVLALSALAAPFSRYALDLLLGTAGIYAVTNLACSLWAAQEDLILAAYIPAAFVTIHAAYGSGFLRGLWTFFVKGRGKAANPSDIRLSR